MKRGLLSFVIVMILGSISMVAQNLTPEMLSFPREKMFFHDKQLMLFNGRGYVSPREFGTTSFTNVNFGVTALGNYEFFINFYDHTTGITIRDDIGSVWPDYQTKGIGFDPLGCNFRHGAPFVMVTQDEKWQPNLYTRTGTFHKELDGKWISFAIKTDMCVADGRDEVLLKMELRNRDSKPLKMTLIPTQQAKELTSYLQDGDPQVTHNTPFKLASDQLSIDVSSTITTKSDKGLEISLEPGASGTYYFAVTFNPSSKPQPQRMISLEQEFEKAQKRTADNLAWAASNVPQVETDFEMFDDFYRRSLLSVLMCRYERDDFIISPFWSVGTWLYTISWDNSFAADVIAMLDAPSLKRTLQLNFEDGQMKRTYIGWMGSSWDNLYIQEPFAQQVMIEAYLKQTGDTSIFNHQAGDATIYEWMKRWVVELHDKYGRKEDGLIDVGYSTEKIIEIRTDGYNHVVPIVNLLTLELYRKMAEWATMLGDKDAKLYTQYADQLETSINTKLWNEEKGWYDNLYKDGSKESIWTYHLYDVIGSDNLADDKRKKMVSHITEGRFLGEYGFYSVARNDSIHWDRVDGDWGGGGQYAGMPTRIARNLYKSGNNALAWDIIKRVAKYTKYFPYYTQNASTDKPIQEMSSMPLQISAGSGVEAVIYGTFGISPQIDGSLTITPVYHSELGHAKLTGFNYRGDSYDVEMDQTGFMVFKNGICVAELNHGETYTK